MITKVQLDSAVSRMENKLDSRFNSKLEALKENFNSQFKNLETKNTSPGVGIISREQSTNLNQENLEEKIDSLETRVLALENILKGLISDDNN